jgi:hypothetical protein
LAVLDAGGVGVVAELGEEGFQVGGECEVDLLVGELVVKGVELATQVGLAGAQVRYAGAEFVDSDQLFSERFDHAGDRGGGLGQRELQAGALADDGISGAAVWRRLSISAWISAGSVSRPVMWSQTTVSR